MNHLSKTLVALVVGACSTLSAAAQANGSNSSYSRFGMGMLSDQAQGSNRNMGGVAQGMRSGSRLFMQNPASYSAIDSLTFIFDAGMSLQRTAMKQGVAKLSTNNTSIDYVNAGFRMRRGLGMSIGFVPFTNIGYTFTQEQKVATDDYTLQPITKTSSFSGSGGMHEIYMGIGWMPFSHFSIGANAGFMWGNLSHALTTSFAEGGTASSYYNSPNSLESAELRTWKVDIGAQYELQLDANNALTLGATVGIGHDIGGDATILRYISNGDSIKSVAPHPYQLPMSYSAGAAWRHNEQWTFAADYSMEKWAGCTTPMLVTDADGHQQYVATKGTYTDRHKLSAGAEYVPSRHDKSYLKRMNYRVGASYATSYLKINGHDGPQEFSLTAGVGLPIANRWNNRSFVNVGVQWVHRAPSVSTMITENYFRLNLGVTFNDQWFTKWKFK